MFSIWTVFRNGFGRVATVHFVYVSFIFLSQRLHFLRTRNGSFRRWKKWVTILYHSQSFRAHNIVQIQLPALGLDRWLFLRSRSHQFENIAVLISIDAQLKHLISVSSRFDISGCSERKPCMLAWEVSLLCVQGHLPVRLCLLASVLAYESFVAIFVF
jgi:hypothetical protein